ncbi:MAG: nicotinamide mononucleotide transporter [Bacteroidales bacterium]|nr:nicotinamide mononucleotide transporter [Bacteroidales bacterium]
MDFFRGAVELYWLHGAFYWILLKHIEIIATLTGFIYLLYSIAGDKKLWLFGLISSSLYVYICYAAGIYADMGINIYYVLVSIYGWAHWAFYHNGATVSEMPYSRAKAREWLLLAAFTGAIYVVLVFVLKKFTNSTIPYIDSFTTALSVTATWMLARKMVEHWLVWIVVDSISAGLYIYKGLYPTSFLFGVYTVLALSGYKRWIFKWKEQLRKL